VSVVVFGLNHKTAPLTLLERTAVAPDDVPKALASLTQRGPVREAVVLSTCNRVEVYALLGRYHEGLAAVRDFVAEWAGVAPEDLADHSYDYFDEGAAAHLFAVAAGLDSMVVGERQIALQVKDAYLRAEEEGACGRALHSLFRRALRVGKRVRAETGIARGASSIVEAGLAAATSVLGSLAGRTAIIVGAGKMGGLAAGHLATCCDRVLVANRSVAKRTRLAGQHGAVPIALDALPQALAHADLVVCSTAATAPVVDRATVAAALEGRTERPLVLLDLAVPRDVDPACRELAGVAVLDLESIRAAIAAGRAGPEPEAFTAELARARELVEEEAAAFAAWMREARIEPTVAALRIRAEHVRRAELARFDRRLAGLDDRQRQAVEALTRGIVNTLLHEPTVRLKALADADEAPHAEVVRDLFDLGEPDAQHD
jgi:glutamyl-tRNA reductase